MERKANACAVEVSTALQKCAWIADSRGNGKREDGSKDEDKAVELANVLLKYGKVDTTCGRATTLSPHWVSPQYMAILRRWYLSS